MSKLDELLETLNKPQHICDSGECFYHDEMHEAAKVMAMMHAALQAIAPYLILSNEPIASTLVAKSRAQELREAADKEEAYERAVRQVRAVLAAI